MNLYTFPFLQKTFQTLTYEKVHPTYTFSLTQKKKNFVRKNIHVALNLITIIELLKVY